MQHDWFMYHLRSTYKNRLDFLFNLSSFQENLLHFLTSVGAIEFWKYVPFKYTEIISGYSYTIKLVSGCGSLEE